MSKYKEIPEGYTVEQIEGNLPFLKNAKFKNATIAFDNNKGLYWNYGFFHNGIFINSYWRYGNFKNGKFINSYWSIGNFYNGIFINSYWNSDNFKNGTFKSSYWNNGYIKDGYFINSIIKKIETFSKFENYSKAKFRNCITLEPRLLKLNRTYSKLTFKGIK